MTPAHHAKTVLTEDGKLALDHLPFRAGQAVEVIVLPVSSPAVGEHPLKGTVLRYDDDPTSPMADGDWDALRPL